MSEHTQGRLVAKHEWLVPESHQDRPIGNSSNPIHDRDNYAHVVAHVRGRYHDQDDNARRLAACWNTMDGLRTEAIEQWNAKEYGRLVTEWANGKEELAAANERIAKLEALVAERDAMLGKRPCLNSRCNELNAARMLLRSMVYPPDWENATQAGIRRNRAKDYLDACDTLEGNKPVEATGCRKCGDILPAGSYCKAPDCPLNPSMKGK